MYMRIDVCVFINICVSVCVCVCVCVLITSPMFEDQHSSAQFLHFNPGRWEFLQTFCWNFSATVSLPEFTAATAFALGTSMTCPFKIYLIVSS